ncbi:ComF family protein [Thermoactinomyces sp. CICC 10522]|uniref:ComF family protein n=1 Tax=Thermoactinomyces sp. CICC 10522 TaxID=2767427 RepID=UPI0018DCFB80|nr:ComF family protein [Thermoactinomyces sp. CICC 10522]MBH8604135.1 ComF family protein [Thermoactinomyces sp. CICC 10522]
MGRIIFEGVWSSLFSQPPTCEFCTAFVRRPSPFAPVRERICSTCLAGVELISGPFCPVCGRKQEAGADHLCPDCLRLAEEERIVNRSPVVYSGKAKEWVSSFKYRGKESLATPMGRWMAEVVQTHFAHTGISVITFVPLHKEKKAERGFNQSELLARVIGARLGLPVLPLLGREKDLASQSRRNRQERLLALKGAFQIEGEGCEKCIRDRTVLIVDDVYTTGTTLRECAKPLLVSGASRVYSVTFAR